MKTTGELPRPVVWAVDLDTSRAWWSQWLMGELSHDELLTEADKLAAQFNLVNKGSQPGFKTIFTFELPIPTGETSNGLEVRSVDHQVNRAEDIDKLLVKHPSVKWSSRQYPLKRTKRGFNDPKFEAQWHLVGCEW